MRQALLLTGLICSCETQAEPLPRAVVRDSAGVTIVENAGPLARDSVAMVVDTTAVVEIGGSGQAGTEFGRVSGTLRLGDGVIVVADGGHSELRFFDSSGAWQRTVGRKGSGPGEFDMIGALYPLGPDSLAVYDINRRRISVFGADGSLIRELTLSSAPEDGFPFMIGVLDGSLLVQTQGFSQSWQNGPRRDTVPVLRYPRWSPPALPLGRFPGSDTYMLVQRNSGGQIATTTSTSLPFGRVLTLRTAGDRLHVGTGDRDEIASYDSAGKLTRLVRWTQPLVPVTDADIAAIKREMLEGFRPGAEARRDRVKGILEAMTFPSTKPAYDSFVVGDEGSLWVERYSQPASHLPARYDVFDGSGQWLGHVTFPARFALSHAGPGYALGVWRDRDDVERVRLYHLEPSPQ